MQLGNLHVLGLSAGQISVYESVLEIGPSTINKIQEKTGIERRNIYDILNKLIEKGFVTYTVEKGRRTYQCTHPNKVLEEVQTQKDVLLHVEKNIPDMISLFESSKPQINAEIFRGNESLKALLNELLEHPESCWIGGNSGIEQATGEGMALWFKQWNLRRIEQKHILHDLVDFGTYLEDYPPEDIKKHRREFYKYCQLPENLSSPMVTVMFGTKVAQVLWSKQSFAFVLDSEEIHESFMKYFKHFWKDPW